MQLDLHLHLPDVTKDEFVIKRNAAVMIAKATQQITSRGNYVNEAGDERDIQKPLNTARTQTTAVDPRMALPVPKPAYKQLYTFVHNQTTLTVAHARHKRGYRVAILNFTHPTNFGSGWMSGRNAQEASLMRSTGLMHCLQDQLWYRDPLHMVNPFYDNTVIVSPQVPVFRGHDGDLLDQSWNADIIGAAPIHVRAVRKHMPARIAEVPLVVARRAARIIEAAASTNANVLVLGAWGCGRFGNNPDVIASAFQAAFASPAIRRFAIIDFAVPDVSLGTPLFATFRNRLHGQTY